jgi:membrane protease YdiL (CAAX protease family)
LSGLLLYRIEGGDFPSEIQYSYLTANPVAISDHKGHAMNDTPHEIIIANLAFMAFWLIVVVAILTLGQRWQRVWAFREKMIGQWKPSLIIALSFAIGMALGGRGLLNPYSIAIFCQSLIGLALARSIPDFEPLSVTHSVLHNEHPWRSLGLMLIIALFVVIPALLIGSVGLSIGQQIFHEPSNTNEALGTFPPNKLLTFFLLWSGAGVAEETPYRLVCLSFVWWLTRRRNLAILISAVIFGLYHLTPLNGMYLTFWQFPISQFLAGTLIGLIWGTIFVKRGFETAVLAHTFSDWIPFLLFVN